MADVAVGSVSCIEVELCNPGTDTIDLTTYIPSGHTADNYYNCVLELPSTLFFSEYIEGSSFNKCLEIYNGTKDTIDLSADNYKIQFFRNGSSAATVTINLVGDLLPDSTYVVCDNSASPAILALTDLAATPTFFNGDDAVVLLRDIDTLDIIGRIGEDPGTRWGTTSLGTSNLTLIRNNNIVIGDTIGTDIFDPSLEWSALPQDDISSLGKHSINSRLNCNVIPDPVQFVPSLDSIALIVFFDDITEATDSILISFIRGDIASFNIENSICAGNSFLFNSVYLKSSGLYRDTISRIEQCDSLVILDLVVLDTFIVQIDTTICAGDSVLVGFTYYKNTGVYIEELLSESNCDSTIRLNLTTITPVFTSILDTICLGDVYTFGMSILDTAGIFRDTLTASSGCDSVVMLNLNFYKEIALDEIRYDFCPSQSDSINLCDFKDSIAIGDYNFNFVKVDKIKPEQIFFSEYMEGSSNNKCLEIYNGTDVTIDLGVDNYKILFFSNGGLTPSNTIDLTGDLLSEDVYVVCDNNLDALLGVDVDHSATGTFYNGDDVIILLKDMDTLDVIGQLGVDPGSAWSSGGVSFQNMTLRRKPNILGGDTISNDPFVADAEWLPFAVNTVSGIGSHTIIDTFQKTMIDSILYNLEDKDSIVVSVMENATGCVDSTFILFEMLSSSYVVIKDTICENETYAFAADLLNLSGTYFDTLSALNTCDSIIQLDLYVKDTFNTILNQTICFGDSFLVDAAYYSEEGSFDIVLTSSLDCDSLVQLNLEVLAPIIVELEESLCLGDQLNFGNQLIETSGTYKDTLEGINHCDSIVILEVSVLDTFSILISKTICEGDSVQLGSDYYNESGRYSNLFQSSQGCDSTVTLDLVVSDTFSVIVDVDICFGDSVFFGSEYIAVSGKYSHLYMSDMGCDSLVDLNLTIVEHVTFTISDSICYGSSYIFNGAVYNVSGEYQDTLTSNKGCDSIIYLNLFVLDIISTQLVDTICNGDVLSFGSSILDTAGMYSDTLTSVMGCDSFVTQVLHLYVAPNLIEINDEICLVDSIVDLTTYEDDIIQGIGSFSYTEILRIRGRDLLISEYTEGSGFNKCIELFNPTGISINFEDRSYSIRIYRNGSMTVSSEFGLEGTVPSDSTFFICDDSADDVLIDGADFLITTAWNGDDAVVLYKDDIPIDVIGRIGEDPGTRWGNNSVSTLNQTLIRKPTVLNGDTSRFDVFVPSLEWTSRSIDDFSDVGAHRLDYLINRDSIETPHSYLFDSDKAEMEVEYIEASSGCTYYSTITINHIDCTIPDTFDLAISILPLKNNIKILDSLVNYIVTISNQGNRDLYNISYGDEIVSDSSLARTLTSTHIISSLAAGSDTSLNVTLFVSDSSVFTNQFLRGGIISALTTKDSLILSDYDGVFEQEELTLDHNDGFEFSIDANLFIENPSLDNDLFCHQDEIEDSITISPSATRYTEALFISQYYEGALFNKCLELYNHTGRAVNLESYSLELYSNGANLPSRILMLDGVIDKGNTFIICNSEAAFRFTNVANQLDSRVMTFNGDDAIVLKKYGVVVDAFGQVGEDPGTQWANNGVNTKDAQLIRKPNVLSGVGNGSISFDPSLQWISVDTSDITGFRKHTIKPDSILAFNIYNEIADIPHAPLASNVSSFSFATNNELYHELWITSIDKGCESEPSRYLTAIQIDRKDLSCLDVVEIVIGTDCNVNLDPANFLTGDFIPEFYHVELYYKNELIDFDEVSNFVNSRDLSYRVFDNCSNQWCWGDVLLSYISTPEVVDCHCNIANEANGNCFYLCGVSIDTIPPVLIDPCIGDTLLVAFSMTENVFSGIEQDTLIRYWFYKKDTLCTQQYFIENYSLSSLVPPKDTLFRTCIDLTDFYNLRLTYPELWPHIIQSGDTIILSQVGVSCNFKISIDDIKHETDCIGSQRLIRRWVIYDWISGDVVEYIQRLESIDITPPVLELTPPVGNGLAVSSFLYDAVVLEQITCQAEFQLPALVHLYDNCTAPEDIRIEYELEAGVFRHDNVIKGLKLGLNRIGVVAYDACENRNVQMINVLVKDISDPFAICRSIELPSMNIYLDGRAKIPLEVFDFGSWDACNRITTRIGRRLDNKFTCEDTSLTFISTKELEFCCEDIGKDIPVSLIVIDAAGNRDECNLTVKVRESQKFDILEDTLRVSCLESVDPYLIGFPATSNLVCFEPRMSWQDSAVITNACEPLQMIRTWYDSATMMNDFQVIIRSRDTSFHPLDIRWPLHHNGLRVFVDDIYQTDMLAPLFCQSEQVDTAFVPPYHCKLLGISYDDQFFSEKGIGCYEVIRKWTVIDWCLYEANRSSQSDVGFHLLFDSLQTRYYFQLDSNVVVDGQYTMDQVIVYRDTIPPLILDCPDVIVTPTEDCEMEISTFIRVEDMGVCSSSSLEYIASIYRDDTLVYSSVWSSSSDSVGIEYAIKSGDYKVSWSVSDGCGNVSSCVQAVRVFDISSCDNSNLDQAASSRSLSKEPFVVDLVNIYPNPFNENITIQLDSEFRQNIEIQVYDTDGRKVFSQKVIIEGLYDYRLSRRDLGSPGIYTLIIAARGGDYKRKIVLFE